MIVIRDTSIVPQDGWQYKVEVTNHTVTTRNYSMLYPEIRKHCAVNNISVPSEQEVVEYLCNSLSIPCYEDETRVPLINKFSMGIPNQPRLGSCCG